mmetsp:Transcript_27521/g.42363  ORF Transcript_27521/g.42363 Transcript_27521/m.42363 type:complete len:364 (+) Transcript_27521:69-1160(+)
MCGRAAQTLQAAKDGAELVGVPLVGIDEHRGSNGQDDPFEGKGAGSGGHEQRDNYNMSPGMDALIIWNECGRLKMGRKVWGLVSKGGTSKNPIPKDDKARMSLHFQNLQFNARVDTLYSKPTFSRLATQGKTCLVPLTGYFEWKDSPLGGKKGKKQPYFVFHSGAGSTCLLMAGLWTQVSTGLPEMPTIDTFTLLTTESNQQIDWLHHRMPVCIWDISLGSKWLETPSLAVLNLIDEAARRKTDGFAWHMVSQDMSSLKFRDSAAIRAVAAPRSVSSFFKASSAPKQPEYKGELPKTSSIRVVGQSPGQASKKRKCESNSQPQVWNTAARTGDDKPKRSPETTCCQKKNKSCDEIVAKKRQSK